MKRRQRNICAVMGLILASGLGGCVQFPDLDAVQTPGVADAPYPTLIPLETLLTGPAPTATVAEIGQVQARVSGLQSRATRLSGVQVAQSGGVADRVAQLQARAAELRAQ